MNPSKSPYVLRGARWIAVAVVLAVLAALVVMQHRRFNALGAATASGTPTAGEVDVGTEGKGVGESEAAAKTESASADVVILTPFEVTTDEAAIDMSDEERRKIFMSTSKSLVIFSGEAGLEKEDDPPRLYSSDESIP